MFQILLEPGNPRSLRREKLSLLIEKISALDESYEVQVGYEEHTGYGVTWWESLHVWLPWGAIGTAAAKKLTELLIDWARHRIKGEPESKRPRRVVIYGADGKAVKEITVDQKGKEEQSDNPQVAPRKKPPIHGE